MTVTDQLLRLHRIQQQIRGLRTRIDAAQKYLDEQDRLLAQIEVKRDALAGQVRQLLATSHNDQTEMNAIEERISRLREQLNNSQTNKQYSALLTEVNTLKADKGLVEERALESMTRLEEVNKAVADLEAALAERRKIREVARAERDRRAQEVQERLSELERERESARAEAPREALALLDAQTRRHDDDAMAPIEEHSRRNHEYACGGCQVILPIELISAILGRGTLTQCVSCGAILYIDASLRESLAPAKR